MHRIDTSTAQVDKFGAGKNGFSAGNPQTGTPATDLDEAFFDMLQEELAGVVEFSGAALDKSKHNQLLTALKALLLSRANPFADIKADGNAAIATAIANLGLKTAALKDVGTASGQIPDMSSFKFSITGDNGYYQLPNGMIKQFGYVVNATPGAVTNVTFPIPFPTKRLSQGFSLVSPSTGVTVQSVLQFITPTLTGFGMANIASIISGNTTVGAPVAGGFYWWAEGY
ncbi:gp53-like domain-containing protein [Kosakonia pseudosacchari]|uniref:gp53-like domain-containing protein n=1 Tax=Kosakonia pseudosacchari TaxID=1646340 RepID=UPI0020D05B03|nr:hypothetical protein [Kosakonia pseudosacchari]